MLSYVERASRWCFWSVEGIGPARMARLLDSCGGDVYALWSDTTTRQMSIDSLRLSMKQQHTLLSVFHDAPWCLYEQELDRLRSDETIVDDTHPLYPAQLRDVADRPSFLYIKGKVRLPAGRHVAMVGSRRVPEHHGQWARTLAMQLAKYPDMTIVSGGALGMDSWAHEGALDAAGDTIVVLPSGLRHPTPSRHINLFRRIVDEGGHLISEYPLDVAARRYHFPRRNRLIVALADGVVVLKANQTGGTMLTARCALDARTPVGVVPYHPAESTAAGSLSLLNERDVFVVRQASDVMKACFGVEPSTTIPIVDVQVGLFPSPARPTPPTGVPGQIFTLCASPVGVDQLSQALSLASAEVMSHLLMLELDGLIQHIGGSRYVQC